MNGKILLDTNIIIAYFAGEALIRDRLLLIEDFFISSTILGELYYGAYKSQHRKENQLRIDKLAKKCAILGCDRDTSRHYGYINNNLRKQGRPIPENDIWIAACAQQHDMVLVTPSGSSAVWPWPWRWWGCVLWSRFLNISNSPPQAGLP